MIKVELFHFGIRRLLRRHALCHSCPNEHFKWNSNGTRMKAKWPTLKNPIGPEEFFLSQHQLALPPLGDVYLITYSWHPLDFRVDLVVPKSNQNVKFW